MMTTSIWIQSPRCSAAAKAASRLNRSCLKGRAKGEVAFRQGSTASNTGGAPVYHELGYESTGRIVADVLRYRSSTSITPVDGAGMVQVQMLYAPWNPADMNTVQGLYPISSAEGMKRIRRSSYFDGIVVAGSEGIGQVVHCSKDPGTGFDDSAPPASPKSALEPGDYVTLAVPSLGTLRSTLTVPESFLLKLERGPELLRALEGSAATASCLFQMGGTALRMLSDFVPVVVPSWSSSVSAKRESAVVMQNAGNSAVGFMVSQIAAIYKVPIVSLVRRGARTEKQVEALVQNLEREGGNNRVVVEDDLHLDQSNGLRALQDELRELCPARSLPKLALNGVGGSSCGLLFRLLDPGGTLVTYGGMSRKPVTVSTAQLIFDDIRVRGYWQSRWMSEASHGSKLRLVNDLVDLVLDHGLKCPPVRVFDLKDYRQALEFEAEQSSQAVRSKVVFNCQ